MTYKRLVLVLAALGVLVISTLFSWYEGGQLIDQPWEWKYTAIFTNWLNGGVSDPNDILAIDHFIYAAKFAPFYPFLMITSLAIILYQLAYWLLKGKKIGMLLFCVIMALACFGASGIMINSPTSGLLFFYFYFVFLGALSILAAIKFGKRKLNTVGEVS